MCINKHLPVLYVIIIGKDIREKNQNTINWLLMKLEINGNIRPLQQAFFKNELNNSQLIVVSCNFLIIMK